MEQLELNKIIELHREWLTTCGKKGESANLRGADLRGADLRNASLDYSAFPLWCGGLDIHIDDKQATQLLYHLIANVQYSKNTSKEIKMLFNEKPLIEQANKFHRIDECNCIKYNPELAESVDEERVEKER